MRSLVGLIAVIISCGSFVQPTSAMVGGGGMHSGPNNTSAMVVMRERQARVRKCSALRGFDYDTMTFGAANGRRQKCS
ncbi:MAG: hypothetical protein JWL86_4488 [Rhizobium sp.]|nr:hypothetical protein [Rhizobium sp.]